MRITYIGHATLLLDIGGVRILTDPNFESALGRFLPRVSAPGIGIEALPPLNALLLTHAHADHLSFKSLDRLPRDIPLFAPRVIAEWLRRKGYMHAVSIEPGETVAVGTLGLRLHAARATHEGNRYGFDRWRKAANMYLLETDAESVFFAGDTALTPETHHLVEHTLWPTGRSLDVALLPIGYAPVPMVKVTGGQRIDLLGVKKEDLVGMWKDLDMPSGYAYAKGIRTVKTCVGSEFCRFGTQNSTQMGIDIEKAFDHMWAPHKVKFAVSGCPRNCAESGIKDVGIIGVDSGWEIYVGGNGGIKTEVAQFLCKVKTHDEVLEYSGAFIQIYREEARYLDRTVHWIHRMGLEYVKQRVVEDAEGRKAAYDRLLYALQGAVEPWSERVKSSELQKQFETIEV